MTFLERLQRATEISRLCVGLDPVPEKMPDHLRNQPEGVERFIEEIVRATSPYASCYKPNLAFFEALGSGGEAALEAAIEFVRRYAPHAIVIGDGKRGDIGSTAERYASALFDRWGFDAATVNPYFGDDGVLPFTERPERGIYLLAATSNPSAPQLQMHGGEQKPLFAEVVRFAQERWNRNRNVGLVVGATRTDMMQLVRDVGPDLPWLIPGVGAQGGDLAQSMVFGLGGKNLPSVINASRSILYASREEDFAEKAGIEAAKMRDAMKEAMKS